MSDMPDLTTTEAVLRWAGRSGVEKNYQSANADLMGCIHYDHGCLNCREATKTAAYIAEAVAFYQSNKVLDALESGSARIAENERLRKVVDGFGEDFSRAYDGSNSYEQGRDRTLLILRMAIQIDPREAQ